MVAGVMNFISWTNTSYPPRSLHVTAVNGILTTPESPHTTTSILLFPDEERMLYRMLKGVSVQINNISFNLLRIKQLSWSSICGGRLTSQGVGVGQVDLSRDGAGWPLKGWGRFTYQGWKGWPLKALLCTNRPFRLRAWYVCASAWCYN